MLPEQTSDTLNGSWARAFGFSNVKTDPAETHDSVIVKYGGRDRDQFKISGVLTDLYFQHPLEADLSLFPLCSILFCSRQVFLNCFVLVP